MNRRFIENEPVILLFRFVRIFNDVIKNNNIIFILRKHPNHIFNCIKDFGNNIFRLGVLDFFTGMIELSSKK